MKNDNSSILKSVSKPGRYSGGEYGEIVKDKSAVKARFAFCFPDSYEIGMSNLGVRILYGVLNEDDRIWCERAYDPWVDMQEKMKENGIPLCAQESGDPLSVFDFVGFTLQYEMCYTNVLNMLDLAKIPLEAKDRGEQDPIIIGGGPCSYNPEPVADFFDLFDIGEGEELLPAIVDLYIRMKEAGTYTRKGFLHEAAKTIPGVYVPAFYRVDYYEDGRISAITPLYDDIPKTVQKQIIKDLDKSYYPDKVVLPYIETVHDRIMLEVYRGCIRGCRFCQAGMIYRPVREKTPEVLNRQAKALYESTGYEEISLSSLSISDYTKLEPLCEKLLSWTDDNMVSLSLPSLRADSFSKELLERIDSVRSSSLTFAPEAGTQRLRDVINKNVREEDVLHAVGLAFDAGKSAVKLYFMNGLPTETEEDILGIAALAEKVVEAFWKNPNRNRQKKVQVTISVACFVPKPFTPFQWEAQDTMERLAEKQEFLKKAITNRHVRYQYHDARVSRVEAILAKGDRRQAKVLKLAFERGFRFDAWEEFFNYDNWMKLFEDVGLDPSFYANRKIDPDEILPWDIIDCGVSKEFFKREREKAYAGITTPNCREQCSACGANKLGGLRAVCPGCHEGWSKEEAAAKEEPKAESPYPVVNPFFTYRIKFKKVGSLQYISHLDLQRTILRVLIRAKIPVWYTQGFNPHPKVIFGLPLSVGTESLTEFIDLRLCRRMPPEEVRDRLNRELTEEMAVERVYESETPFREIAYASYEMALQLSEADDGLVENLKTLYTKGPLLVTKKTKSGEKEIDVVEGIKEISLAREENTIKISALLSAKEDSYLNPELLVTEAKKAFGILADPKETYSILRTHVYLADGREFE
ncbi:MAG: TIGR03960 family B12-binding radical SAM protein [Clostridia bacterium]|nr:TIGR03960 family B12-binding radical SAM protein [Clostridia bacterium]